MFGGTAGASPVEVETGGCSWLAKSAKKDGDMAAAASRSAHMAVLNDIIGPPHLSSCADGQSGHF